MKPRQKIIDKVYHFLWFLFIFQVNNILDCISYWTSSQISNDDMFIYLNFIEIGIFATVQILTIILLYLKQSTKKTILVNIDFHFFIINIILIIIYCEFEFMKKKCQNYRNQMDFALILGIFIQTSLKFIKNRKLRMMCFGIELIYIVCRVTDVCCYNIQRLLALMFGLLFYYGWKIFKESKEKNKDKNKGREIDKSILTPFWTEVLKESNDEGIAVFDCQKKLIMNNEKINRIIIDDNINNLDKKLMNFKLRFVSFDSDSDSEDLGLKRAIELSTEFFQINVVDAPINSNTILEHFQKEDKVFSLYEIMNDIIYFIEKLKLHRLKSKQNKTKSENKLILIFEFRNAREFLQIKDEFNNARLILTIFLKNRKVKFFFLRIQIYLDQKLLLEAEKKSQNSKIFSVSHEMRTPLNCIVSMLQMLKFQIKDELHEEFITPAITSCNFLLYLVQDLLDMAEMESQKFIVNYEEFDVRLFINDIMRLFTLQSRAKNVEITQKIANNIPETIISDHRRIRQILVNLIGNSLKFVKIKGRILLDINVDPKNLTNIIFKIIDNGIGIKEEDKKTLFQAFGKIRNDDNKKMNSTGVGLGLMISNNIAINLNPNKSQGLLVESQYGCGTTFSFIIEDKTEVFNLREHDSYENANDLYMDLLNKNCEKKFFEKESEEICIQTKSKSVRNPTNSSIKIDIENSAPKNFFFKKNNNNLSIQNQAYSCSITSFNRPKSQKSQLSQKSLKSFVIEDSSMNISFSDVLLCKRTSDCFDSSSQKLSILREIKANSDCLCPEILIVDDNAFNVLSLKKQLEFFNFKIDSANDGEEAINLVENYFSVYQKNKCCRNYSLIFMDIEMPGKNGYETALEIRKIFKMKKSCEIIKEEYYCPIIACSAHLKEEEPEKHKKFGIDEFVTKPLMKEKLIILLGEYLNFNA